MNDSGGPRTKAVRARVAHHLQQMVTLAATTTLTTTACACDMIPPPARVPLDAATLGPSATLLQEANTIYLDITVPNNGYCTFDPTFGDVEGSLVVQSYVAFPDDKDSGKRPSSYAEAAGNQVVFEQKQEDPTHIHVRNDTCAEFFVRIVADVTPTNGLASMGGGGGVSSGGAGGETN